MCTHASTLDDRIIALFERHREKPDSTYSPDAIIHYLFKNEDGAKNVHNCFKGKKRFVRFMSDLENEFIICFSKNDFEAMVSLEDFRDRIQERISNPRSSKASLKNRMKEPFNLAPSLAVLVLGLAVALFLMRFSAVLAAGFMLIPAYACIWIFRTDAMERRHNKQLFEKLSTANQANPTSLSGVAPTGGY